MVDAAHDGSRRRIADRVAHLLPPRGVRVWVRLAYRNTRSLIFVACDRYSRRFFPSRISSTKGCLMPMAFGWASRPWEAQDEYRSTWSVVRPQIAALPHGPGDVDSGVVRERVLPPLGPVIP
jgi:hypothetical protein